jgi:hypothetical protein
MMPTMERATYSVSPFRFVHDGHLKIDHDCIECSAAEILQLLPGRSRFIAHFPAIPGFRKRTHASAHQRAVIYDENASPPPSD